MEDRPRRLRRKPARSVGEKTIEKISDSSTAPCPHITELIGHGEITVGELSPVGCAAIAHDEGQTLAMLARRPGETFLQLLTRLDQAIAKAYTEDVFTDEINPPLPPSKVG